MFRCWRDLLRSALVALALVGGVGGPVLAQGDDALYQALGGKPGIEALVDVLAHRLIADPRTRSFFTEADPKRMMERLGAQFCDVAGGPCKTIKPDMQKVHAGVDIRPADFEAFMAIVEQSLVERNVAQPQRSELLRRLMPMRSAIVNAG